MARLRWQCRRGMRELDLLLERFLDHGFPGADAVIQAAFYDLLRLDDGTLSQLLLGNLRHPDPAVERVARLVANGTAPAT